MDQQGYDIEPQRSLIPGIKKLLHAAREAKYPVFHCRESYRADLSDVGSRELFRSRNNPSGLGIGDRGPLGRLLIRGEPGCDTVPELYPIDGEPVIDKPTKGAFTATDFEKLLRNKGVRNLILCGATTDVCVHTTMREANDRGFDCLLVEDLCSATDEELHKAAIKMITMEGGIFGVVSPLSRVLPVIKGE